MNLDTLILAGIVREMQREVLGAKVDRIAQPGAFTTVWSFYGLWRGRSVLVDSGAETARLHFTVGPRKNAPSPPAFCMLLRKHLDEAYVQGIEQPLGYGERVVRIMFAREDGASVALWIELMGRHSNQILTDSKGTILGSIKRVTTEMSRYREIRAGLQYTPPPRQRGGKRDAFSPVAGNDLPENVLETPEAAVAWLLETFSGISPLMAREAVARTVGIPLTTVTVWYGLNDLLNAARLGEYEPVLLTDSLGRVVGAYSVPLLTWPAEQQVKIDTVNGAVDKTFEDLIEKRGFDQERSALLSALRHAQKSAYREALDVAEGIANSERADEYKESGELLLAQSIKVKPGDEIAVVTDFATGEVREIALDPAVPVHANAERYFKKYRKARDAKDRLIERQAAVEARLAALVELIDQAEAAQGIDALQRVLEQTETVGALTESDRQAGQPEAAREASRYAGYRIKSLRSVDGWEILVGENSESNDYLTTKVASPNDIWLHARASASAHAVIRSQNRPASVSAAALRFAAEQVARRSAAKHSRLVAVDYTLKKYVRKPRNSHPGEVTYSREKTLDVHPEAAGSD